MLSSLRFLSLLFHICFYMLEILTYTRYFHIEMDLIIHCYQGPVENSEVSLMERTTIFLPKQRVYTGEKQ